MRPPTDLRLRHALIALVLAGTATLAAAATDIFAAPEGGWKADASKGGGVIDLTSLGNANAKILLSVPDTYTIEAAHPLAIVLHGGPGGKAESMAGVFRRLLDERGVISVYPQALQVQLLDWNYPHSTVYLLHVIRQVAQRYRIDPRRIYLLGHSMGGGGTWAQGAILSDIWAGIGPLSGWAVPTPAPNFRRLATLPIWCIHGDGDQAVPAQLSRMAFTELAKYERQQRTLEERPADLTGLDAVRHVYRELEGIGHNVFDPRKTLGNPELSLQLDWLLAHHRDVDPDLAAAQAQMVAWGKRFGWTPDAGFGSYGAEKQTDDTKSKPQRR